MSQRPIITLIDVGNLAPVGFDALPPDFMPQSPFYENGPIGPIFNFTPHFDASGVTNANITAAEVAGTLDSVPGTALLGQSVGAPAVTVYLFSEDWPAPLTAADISAGFGPYFIWLDAAQDARLTGASINSFGGFGGFLMEIDFREANVTARQFLTEFDLLDLFALDPIINPRPGDVDDGGADPIPVNGTDAAESLTGSDEGEVINGAGGDDTVTGGRGDDTLSGGEGTDTAQYSGDQDSYTLQITPNGFVLDDRRDGGDGTDTLQGFEFLDFEGGSYFDGGDGDLTLFDLRQFADFATLTPEDFRTFVEIYIAYFDRAPDAVGLYFWGTVLAKGARTVEEIADEFFTQAETQATYPDLTDNVAFASAVYQNVLGREFDQAGLEFWVDLLDRGVITQGRFILDILEGVDAPAQPGDSAETIAQRALDAQYLETKTDLGIYYSVILGMSDVEDARDAMALYDGTPASVTAALAEMDADYAEALDPLNGEFLMPLVGVVDDPFGV